ncbi:MAG: DUF1549 and DUF1553 domain-containing protein [Pseudomonadota bacterium]
MLRRTLMNAIDRFLASPRFGERWASVWLDAARYADSKGYDYDRIRHSWPYRDWVVSVFNENLPYSAFVQKQLAGDLRPNRSMDDLIATSFLRQNRTNDEAGADDEQFRMEATMDRNALVWSVINGLTMNCVQCHSHPYDPIRNEEYYTSLAFFNNSADHDLTQDVPVLHVPIDNTYRDEVWRLNTQVEQLRAEIVDEGLAFVRSLPDWTPAFIREAKAKGFAGESALAGSDAAGYAETPEFEFNDGETTATVSSSSSWIYEFDIEISDEPVSAIRFDVIPLDEAKAIHTPEEGFIVREIDARFVSPNGDEGERLAFHYFIPDAEENIAPNRGPSDNVMAPYPSVPREREYDLNYAPMRLLGSGAFVSVLKLRSRRWTVGILSEQQTPPAGSRLRVRIIHDATVSSRSAMIRRLRVQTHSSPKWLAFDAAGDVSAKYTALRDAEAALDALPTQALPVMADMRDSMRRDTLAFNRGNWLTKVGEALTPTPPNLFPAFSPSGEPDRLDLAEWFFDPAQPLTARVAVNRIWGQLFGFGIVRSQEDFGSVGEEPTHPALLDWLALHFQDDLNWDTKALMRTIVTSAAYKQSSRATDLKIEIDPDNRLLSRGPRQRLSAEMVRDQALFAAGLLNEKMGGEPVEPPIIARGDIVGSEEATFQPAEGAERYRRAIYTGIKRTAIYPSLLIFDMKQRDMSSARRNTTNTPSQALVTLNEDIQVEAARALGRRMCAEASVTDVTDITDLTGASQQTPKAIDETFAACVNHGAKIVLSRTLTADEMLAFSSLYKKLLSQDTSVNDGRRADSAAATEERWSLIASALLNLDAALTR